MNLSKLITLICGLFLFCGLLSVACTNVDFNNPLDKRGTNVDSTDANNNKIWDIDEDDDGNGIPNGYEDDDGDGILNKDDPDSEHHVKDTIPPVFKKPSHDTDSIAVTVEDKDSTAFNKRLNEIINSVTATDNRDGNIKVEVSQSVSRIVPGVYPITYTARDLDGNTASITRYVIVYEPSKKDITPPIITMFGPDTAIIKVGEPYLDQKATAWDAGDDAIIEVTKSGDEVNVNKAGTYIIIYTAVDKSGNKATKTRVVIVEPSDNTEDNDIPVITLKGSDTVVVYTKSEFKEPGYSAYDATDGDISSRVTIDMSEWEDATEPGNYTIYYKVQDAAGNNAQTKSRVISWVSSSTDKTKPVITIEGGKTEFEIKLGNSWALLEPKVTANDNKDGNITNKITKKGTVDSSKVGTYEITYSVKDNAGNEASITITVKVVEGDIDTTKPVIKLNGKNPDTVALKEGGTYSDPGATATDDGKSIAVKVSGEVNMGKAGKYTLTYTATDASGNTASVERVVVVVEGAVVGDLLKKYNVPGSKPFEKLENAKFTSFEVEGTEKVTIGGFESLQFNWSGSTMYSFAISTGNTPPYYFDLKEKSTINLGSTKPSLTITGATNFSGLDGEYYVTMSESDMVWVKKDGSMAIIWKP